MSNFDFVNVGVAVSGAVGQRVQMETVEGIVRTGKLTSVRWREIKYADHGSKPRTLKQPLELILDNDEGDPVPWANLIRFGLLV